MFQLQHKFGVCRKEITTVGRHGSSLRNSGLDGIEELRPGVDLLVAPN
jgi:hypothetical protein